MHIHRLHPIHAVYLSALAASCGSDNTSSRPSTFTPVNQSANPIEPTPPPPQSTIQPQTPPTQPPPVVAQPTATGVGPAATDNGLPITPPASSTPIVPPPATDVTPTPPPATTGPAEPATPTCAGTGDATIPQVESGWFPSTSNQSCFQGSWYCFDDGEVPTSCETDVAPWDETETAMCLSGSTIMRAEPDDYSAWGAGIGVSLNDESNKKLAFDADALGLKGFKFSVSGSLGGATLKFMIPLTSKDTEDRPPEFIITDIGDYSVDFDEVMRPIYDAATDEADPSDPTELYQLKWQIVGGDGDYDYDFCVSNVEPY